MVPQQPPTMPTSNSSTISRRARAIGSGSSGNDGQTVDVDRDAGVRDDRDRLGGCTRPDSGPVRACVRAGRAVEADDVDRQVLEDVERGGDIGAEQHPAGGIERDRGLDRDERCRSPRTLRRRRGSAAFSSRMSCTVSMIRMSAAAIDQSADLVEEEIDDLLEAVLAEHRVFGGGQETGRADRAGHEARAGWASMYSSATRRASVGGGAVQLVGLLAETVLLELDQAAAEGVGFEHIARRPRGSEAWMPSMMDGFDEDQVVVAALLAAVVLGGELHVEDGGAHRAVVDDDALGASSRKPVRASVIVAGAEEVGRVRVAVMGVDLSGGWGGCPSHSHSTEVYLTVDGIRWW